MKTLLLLLMLAALAHGEPVKLIFDTDMGNDVDDLLALGMIHSLQRRGHCELLAVTITKDHPQAAAFVDAVNTFYGRPDIPIGVVRNGFTHRPGKFILLADEKNADGTFRYPHDLLSGKDAPEATGLLRETLARQPDGSVSLVQVGFFTNFARLLDSPPDKHSPLAGRDLIQKKVRLLALMAGAFKGTDPEWQSREYNARTDLDSAQKLTREWPTPIVWCGYEIGLAAAYPHESVERDYNYVRHHPLKEAYYLARPPSHDRPTWDPATLLYAVLPERGYFKLSEPGAVSISGDVATDFLPAEDGKGRDRFLILDDTLAARVREAIVQLSSEPPARLPSQPDK
jgi:inosine-uridine nucleoside N-ribohydrolase